MADSDAAPNAASEASVSRAEGRAFLSHEPLSLDTLMRSVSDPSCGAIATFSGVTRNSFEGREVVRLEYEAYESMALKEMEKLVKHVMDGTSFPGVRQVACVHRLGVVPIAEASVLIAVAAEHRPEAFEACKYLIDEIKAKVPIWKKEIYADGSTWKANKEWCPPIVAEKASNALETPELQPAPNCQAPSNEEQEAAKALGTLLRNAPPHADQEELCTVHYVEIAKSVDAKLGLDVQSYQNRGLKVVRVREGIVLDSNLKFPDNAICEGDIIVKVNDVANDTKLILAEISRASYLDIEYHRTVDILID